MNTMKKKQHIVAGTIIGGLLLAATMHTTSTFALSDSSSDTTDPSTGATQTDPTTTTDPTTPTTPPDGSVADGSTANQTAGNTVDSSQTTGSSTDPSTDPSTTTSSDPTAGTNNTSSDPTGTGSDPTVNNTNTTAGNTTEVDNTVNSAAQSGDATVSNNGRGGSATTGDASGIATLINAIASSTDLGAGGGLQTFTLNLNGTQNGNITLDPNQLLNGTLIDPTSTSGQSDVGGQNNSTINNNVNLSATSGNANVTDNGRGGNATSGNATTEADIVNLIESLISDKKAFLGVININGTLNGNILLPASVIDQLLKDQGSGADPSNLSAANNISVNNNVDLTAQSGTASVINNDHGGNATSGNATTKLNIYNLINSQIVGGNVLLVFVNVMGNWYGLLMNAPAGTTSAALGGGITQSSQGGDTSVPGSQVFGVNNETINNNVTLTSTTGDATVSGNHRGGNATTGNASAVADIVNILGSQINLSGWLGILVINVFGTWNGSLDVQPDATTSAVGGPTHHSSGNHHHGSKHHSTVDGFAYYINYNGNSDPIVTTAAHVLGDSTDNNNGFDGNKHVAVVYDHSKNTSSVVTDAVIAGFAAAAAGAAAGARYLSLHRKKG